MRSRIPTGASNYAEICCAVCVTDMIRSVGNDSEMLSKPTTRNHVGNDDGIGSNMTQCDQD